MNIGLDLDGVIYRWHESVYRYFCEFKGFTGSVYDFWLRFIPLSGEQYLDYYMQLPTLYMDTTPREDVIKTLPKIAKLHTIYYITARPEEMERITGKFFDYYDLPFKENLIFSKDKDSCCRLFKLDWFLDDLPQNLEKISKPTKTILFRAVHNIPRQGEFENVGTLSEFLELVKETRRAKLVEELGFREESL